MADSDLLLAGTGYLAKKYGSDEKPCDYIPSGVEFARWIEGADRIAEEGAPAHSPFVDFPKPHLGYCGSIGSRIDAELLNEVAAEFAEASLILVGPAYGDRHRQFSGPNIHLVGNRPAATLPDIVPRFDVGLVPFVINDATRALNPIKVLEYLAAGVPVVSVPLPDVIDEFSDVVELAADASEFVAAIRRILSWSPEERAARVAAGRERVSARTWQAQGDEFCATIREALGGAPPRSNNRSIRADRVAFAGKASAS